MDSETQTVLARWVAAAAVAVVVAAAGSPVRLEESWDRWGNSSHFF
jgi:hypothetical protein